MKFIEVVTKAVGFHYWSEAPEDVCFLRNRHRHYFGIKVAVKVSHGEREVEFFQLQRIINLSVLPSAFPRNTEGEYEFGTMSCEHIAEVIATRLLDAGYGVISVVVSEDGENSGGVLI